MLRGVSCGNASLSRGVDVTRMVGSTEADNYVGTYDVASIDAAYNPRKGDTFDHPDGEFLLDRLVHDNGVIRQFIVVERS